MVEQEEKEPEHFYNTDFKKELEAYRQIKKQTMLQEPTVESNLDQIFSNFQVFTQQRHKVSLNQLNDFVPVDSKD